MGSDSEVAGPVWPGRLAGSAAATADYACLNAALGFNQAAANLRAVQDYAAWTDYTMADSAVADGDRGSLCLSFDSRAIGTMCAIDSATINPYWSRESDIPQSGEVRGAAVANFFPAGAAFQAATMFLQLSYVAPGDRSKSLSYRWISR